MINRGKTSQNGDGSTTAVRCSARAAAGGRIYSYKYNIIMYTVCAQLLDRSVCIYIRGVYLRRVYKSSTARII